jgi:hypothetical protein
MLHWWTAWLWSIYISMWRPHQIHVMLPYTYSPSHFCFQVLVMFWVLKLKLSIDTINSFSLLSLRIEFHSHTTLVCQSHVFSQGCGEEDWSTYFTHKPSYERMNTNHSEAFLRGAFLLSTWIWLLDAFHRIAEGYRAIEPWIIVVDIPHVPIPSWVV